MILVEGDEVEVCGSHRGIGLREVGSRLWARQTGGCGAIQDQDQDQNRDRDRDMPALELRHQSR